MDNEGFYRFSIKLIGRRDDTNMVYKMAYNNRSNLTNRNTGKKYYHRSRGSTLYSELMIPENSPPGFKEKINCPEALASEIEKCEKRWDAQLMQEAVISVPSELSLPQQIGLVRSFVDKTWVSKGRVAQIDIHPPPLGGDPRQVHAHVLLSLRHIEDDSDSFGLKNNEWTYKKEKGPSLVEEWREEWANAVNAAYERYGYQIRVDHRSLKDRGIERTPQRPKGQARANIERREMKLKENTLHQDLDDPGNDKNCETPHEFEDIFFMD
jgi:hypothetical protein